ncbi:hypothetical_protein_-_conserved [Leishmania infantum]|uniref:Hypothetical_protein_-_conserved n=1 Tax=Leishmania infantum TaxID=5671 RepID=A0A6L0XM13_LEIIN|nr:hypothetical_protein_-_conserved [Leishmania infantum]SUZ43079.1 hypothetical_protein_-_conserved [Leishmania infantum]
MSGSRTSLPSPSYAAQPARPPPAGVLSADLARPISVRELAQSRVPAVPPPPPATQAPRPSATTAGFAGFGVPTSSAVYAATSGVSTSRPLSTHADAGDLTSLAHRGIDHLSGSELYNYASHLQESSRQYSGYLSAAYAKRDQYRGEVAHLKEELHNRYVEIDALRREQERASDALLKVREDNAQLRQKLAEAEGHARNMQAKMSVLSGADPSIAVHFYQSQLALKDAQLRELQQECERAAAASSQRRSSSTTAAEHGRRSANISGEGAAAPHTSPSRDLPSAEELQDGAEAASAALHTALEELQCLNTSLSHRLEEEHTAHKAALAAHAEASATATADRAELLDTIAQLRQQCADMQSAEDELVAALTQRAPISKKDYASLQASYDDLTAALAKAEAQVAALQEKEQQHHHSAQQAQEELRHSLTTGLEERQSMQARNEQMQSLVNNLERELELAERANQLRQEQLDVAISGNQQLAESLHVAQEQLLSATSELQDLRDTRESLESQLRELRQRIEELEQGEQHQRHRHGGAEAERTLIHTPAASAESEASQQRQESEAELASLRSQRDAVVGDRDDIIGEVRRLPDERRALLISPPAHAEEQLQSRSSAVRAPLDVRADDREWQKQEDIAALEAAHQCIEQMKQTIAALQSERVRVEADLKAEVNTLEAELASQSRALAEAEAAAAAQQAHLEEVMAALRDELVATQAQEKRLRASEEAHRERCAEHQRAVEQLQAHVEELERAARDAASSLPTPPPAQPSTAAESELRAMNAALDSLAYQLEDAQHRVKELSAEHARTVEELARATRAVAELEARAADAEGKHEVMHTAAEVTEAELMARVAALTAENAQLREKLSTSRAAVTTFASRQTDGESAAASLEERCAAEARRSEAAEAEASALRETLNGTAAELAEVLQRSEDVQATLERTVARLAEQESLVGVLSAESTRLQDELATAQRSVLLLTSERDALGEEAAGLRGKISAAEDRASDAAAAQQRLQACLEEAEAAVRSKDVELSTALAALDRTASEVCDAEQRLQVYSEAKEQLAAEHARTVEELARATRAVAELEARAADAEGKHEVMHTAAEVTEAELMARVAALTAENAQLREKLSTSRAAVTTFASRQTDGESAAASLEERCAAEARRSEAAEAEASALRETLNGTAAELAEVLQRSEDVQATLERTVARLAEQESLVGVLSAESTRLQDELATAQRSVLLLTSERDALGEEAAGLRGKISAAEDRASDAAAAQQRLQACLEEAEAAVRSKDVELSTALAALDRTASEVCDAEQRLQVYSEAKEQLAAEHARTVEELARATRAVAELEARAADAEGKHEVMHTAAEVTEAELMARVAALTAENAQLREKLSTSRAAVTTFASRQTDGESAAASLEERCAAEARRSEAAEAEASALRETLNGTAAELAEVLQRSEDVQATLERTVARLAEQESLVGVLSAESTRLQDELATAQRSVLLLTSERDALGEEAAGLRGKISAAEDRASDAAAAQQRLQACLEEAEAAVRSKDVELSTALAALDRTASEVCDAEQRLQVYSEAKEQLAAEHARTVEELARATRAVAELEARAADAEGKHEVMHTAAEVTEAELMARVAALTAENAQLREKLSTSRAAVTTFASRQTDGESAAASLEERCAAEARRSEAAEAEASALRETLNGTAAELAEVLQRSEDVQATLERTVARLAEQEALVEQLNYDASELNDARAVLTDEVTRLQKALAAAVSDKADVVAQLLATQKELDRAAEAQDAQYRDEERLQDALATTTSAFDVQTTQVRLGMAHVVDMSRAFCRVAEVAVQRSASQTDGASGTGTSVQEILSPWTRALEWVAAMEQRLEALDRGAMPNSFTRTNGRRERRRRRRGRTTESENDDAVEMESNSGSYVLGTSPLCRAVPANRAEAAFARLIDEQAAATNTIADLRRTLADKEVDLTNLRSAMDALASDLMGERDRADNLSAAIDDASEKIASAQAEFEEQLRQRTAVTTAEVVEARRAEARATAAQLRAEEQLAAVEKDLKEQEAVLRKLQDENHRLTREADRLLRTSRLEPSSRARSNVSGSVTPKSLSLSATSAENAAQRFTTAPSTLEAIEQAQILQVSSLQADLMLSRRQARELEGREATLRQACAALEQQVSELRAKAAEAEHLREDLATLRADYVELEQRYSELELMATAAGGGTMQELKQLRQQLKVREAELEEVKARMRDLVLSKAAPELQAARRQEALRESLSGITTQLAATQAQYGGGTGGSSKARSRRDSLTAALSNSDLNLSSSRPSPQDVLNSRIEHLQTLVHDREVALEKVQAAQLESRAAMDTLEDQLAAKTAALERAEGLVAEYADTINAFTMAAVARRGNRGAVSTTVPPLSSGMGSPDAEALSASVPTLTPLTPRTRAAVNGQPHAAVAMVSPAPRMPNLDEVADDSDGSGEGKQADSAGPSTDSAPPPVTHRRTSASGSWRGAKSCPAHRPSSSTERSAPSSPSNVPGRKSFAGASVPATTRKRARSSTNS